MWCQIQKCCWARPLPVIKLLATQRGPAMEKGGCFPHWPPGLSNCVQLVPLRHQLSPGPPAGLAGPAWPPFSHSASCLVYLQLYLVFWLPEALATGQLVRRPCSVIRRPVHHQQGCWRKLSHIAFGCIWEKRESLADLFLSPFSNALQVWCFPHTLGNVFPPNLRLTPTTS